MNSILNYRPTLPLLFGLFTLMILAVGMAGATVPASVMYYIPINVINSQASATTGNFQEMISFNALAVCNAILCSSHLNNTEFFYANGTVMNSWYESGAGLSNNYGTNSFSTSTNVIAWVLLSPANYIPASGSNTIYMGFAANTVNNFNSLSTTGEAPQLSIAGFIDVGTPIPYKSTSSDDPTGSGATATPSDSSAPLYICAGALNSNQYDGLYQDSINTNYPPDIQDDIPITSVGNQTIPTGGTNNCQASSGNFNDPVVVSAISLESGAIPYQYFTGHTYGPQTSVDLNNNGGFQVTGTNAFVVVAVACGYEACDNTPQANTAGNGGGGINIVNGGDNPLIGSQCFLQTSEDYDGYENTSIYTCNSLGPGNYDVVASANGGGGGAEMSLAAYVFQNVTSSPINPINYAEYDNGARVFSYYTNFAGPTLPSSLNPASATPYTVSDGLTQTGGGTIESSASFNSLQYATEEYGYESESTTGNDRYFAVGTNGGVGGGTGVAYFEADCCAEQSYLTYPGATYSYDFPGTVLGSTTPAIYSLWMNPTSVIGMYNYVSGTLTSPASASSLANAYFGLGGAQTTVGFYQWLRQRRIPPNGIMPTTSLGSVTPASSYTPPTTPSQPIACSAPVFTASFISGNTYTNIDTANTMIAYVTAGPSNVGVLLDNTPIETIPSYGIAGGFTIPQNWSFGFTFLSTPENVIIQCVPAGGTGGMNQSQTTAIALVLGLYIAAVCLLSMGIDKTIERHIFYLLVGFLMLIAATGLAIAYVTIV